MKILRGNERAIRPHQQEIAVTVARWTQEAARRGEAILPQDSGTMLTQLRFGLSVLLVESENPLPLGHLTTYVLGRDLRGRRWWKVGTGIVPPEFRGRGLGGILYSEVAKMHPQDMLVGTSKNPVAVHLSVEAGFKIEPYTKIPAEIREGLCYQAPCFVQDGHGLCRDEHNRGGPCVARIRWPR